MSQYNMDTEPVQGKTGFIYWLDNFEQRSDFIQSLSFQLISEHVLGTIYAG